MLIRAMINNRLVRVHSVDAFQGQENEVVIFSMVRHNENREYSFKDLFFSYFCVRNSDYCTKRKFQLKRFFVFSWDIKIFIYMSLFIPLRKTRERIELKNSLKRIRLFVTYIILKRCF